MRAVDGLFFYWHESLREIGKGLSASQSQDSHIEYLCSSFYLNIEQEGGTLMVSASGPERVEAVEAIKAVLGKFEFEEAVNIDYLDDEVHSDRWKKEVQRYEETRFTGTTCEQVDTERWLSRYTKSSKKKSWDQCKNSSRIRAKGRR